MKKGDAVELNSTVTAYVVNGVIYYANAETAGSTDTALVLAAPGSMDKRQLSGEIALLR